MALNLQNSWFKLYCNAFAFLCIEKEKYTEKLFGVETIFTQKLLVNFRNKYKVIASNTLNMNFGSGKAEIAFSCKRSPVIIVLFTTSNILQCNRIECIQ